MQKKTNSSLKLRKMIDKIIMEQIKKALSEAKTAWNGRFENLDRILTQNYDQMKDSDKQLKDTLFGSYYRYFNDGDVLAFPSGLLKKIGAPEAVIQTLSGQRSSVKSRKAPYQIRRGDGGKDWRYPNTKEDPVVQRYEKAMEGAILATFKYFKTKYPNFFNSEGRQKTIQQWKKEVIGYAQSKPTELDTFWVGEFGKQFGKPELANYAKRRIAEKFYKITDPDEIGKVITMMLKSLKQGA